MSPGLSSLTVEGNGSYIHRHSREASRSRTVKAGGGASWTGEEMGEITRNPSSSGTKGGAVRACIDAVRCAGRARLFSRAACALSRVPRKVTRRCWCRGGIVARTRHHVRANGGRRFAGCAPGAPEQHILQRCLRQSWRGEKGARSGLPRATADLTARWAAEQLCVLMRVTGRGRARPTRPAAQRARACTTMS